MQSTRFSFLAIPLAMAVAAAVVMTPTSQAQGPDPKGSAAKKGTFEKIKVHGKALEGNLEGDSPDRDVFVYLPPSYGSEPARRYPVVYFLHGYGIGAEQYWNIMTVPDAADKGGLRARQSALDSRSRRSIPISARNRSSWLTTSNAPS